jgi:hypothetical protein
MAQYEDSNWVPISENASDHSQNGDGKFRFINGHLNDVDT